MIHFHRRLNIPGTPEITEIHDINGQIGEMFANQVGTFSVRFDDGRYGGFGVARDRFKAEALAKEMYSKGMFQ